MLGSTVLIPFLLVPSMGGTMDDLAAGTPCQQAPPVWHGGSDPGLPHSGCPTMQADLTLYSRHLL